MSKMKVMLSIMLVVCVALVGCGSKEKKNLVGSTSVATTIKAQAAGTQAETSTVQGLSALQSILKAMSGQEKSNAAISLGPNMRTVTNTFSWKKGADGYYTNKSEDHRGSTYVFRMRQEPDWWDWDWSKGTPWAGKAAGDYVVQKFITKIEYNAPADGVKSIGDEVTSQTAKMVSGGGWWDYSVQPPVYVTYLYPDFSGSAMVTKGSGTTTNSTDGTSMTYAHDGTASYKMTYEEVKGTQSYTDPYSGQTTTWETVVGGKWTWATKNTEKMTFNMSTGYAGEFDVVFTASFSGGWGNGQMDSMTNTEDLKVITDGKLLKDGTRVATVHIEARNVVTGMKIEGYYTVPEENDAVKHELDSSKYGFMSKEMFKEKQGSKTGSGCAVGGIN
jgi:hypothetical protein